MKPFLFIALLATISCDCFSQKRDTSFLKNGGFSVSLRDSADYIRIVTQPDSFRKAYLVTDFYKSGKRKLEGLAINDKPIAFDGEVVSYFENGNQHSSSMYKDGKSIATRNRFYPNGKLYVVETYLGTNEFLEPQFLIVSAFDSLGNALVKDGNGYFKGYDDPFKKVIEEGFIKTGKKSGEWTFADSTYTRLQKYDENGAFVSGRSKNNKTGEIIDYAKEEIMPAFPGGQKQLVKFIAKNFNYPKMDRKNKIGGRILVQFVINKEGKVVDVKTINHISPDIDKEAIRLIESFPTWTPGLQYGCPVRAQYTIPISLSFE